jgi:hypothetical protein
MRRIFIFFFLSLAAHFCAHAQADLRWSEYVKSADQGGEILGFAGGKYYSVMVKDRIPYLVAYSDDDLTPGVFHELPLGPKVKAGGKSKAYTWDEVRKRRESEKSRIYLFEKAFLFEDRVVLIYYRYVKPEKMFYAQAFSLNGSPLSAMIELDKIEEKRTSNLHYFGLSQDSSKIYLFHQPKLRGDEQDRCYLKAWNRDLDPVQSSELNFPYKNRDFAVYDYYLTPKGTLVSLVRIDTPKKERDDNAPPYSYKLITVDSAASEFKTYDMQLDRVYIRDINLRFDEQYNAYCVGTYSDDRRNQSLKGTFFYRFDYVSGLVNSLNREDFPKELIHQLNNSESKRRRNQELRANIELKAVHAKRDGGNYVLFEEEYLEVYTSRGPNGTFTTTYYYHNNDILIMNISPKGEILWQAVIPKQQVSTNDYGYYNGFFSMVYNDSLYIFTNDNIRNIEENSFEHIIGTQFSRSTFPVVILVDPEGNFKKEALEVLDRKRDHKVSFRKSCKISDQQAVIYAFKNRRGIFQGRIQFKVGRIVLDAK